MITINKQTFKGRSVSIINNKIIIDGKDVTDSLPESKVFNIEVNGDLDTLEVDNAEKINITGNVGSINTTNADVTCNNVEINVTTVNGNVEAQGIRGNVQTVNGDVRAEQIHGSVKTSSGDIKYKK